MTREQIIKTFEDGAGKYKWLFPVKFGFLMLFGIGALVYAAWLTQVVSGFEWVYFGFIVIIGIKLISGEIRSLSRKEWQDGCQTMLKFLNGRHNHLAWVYFCAAEKPDSPLSKAPENDGLYYWLIFWFTDKQSCKVYGKKAELDKILRYFKSNYPEISTGFSTALEKQFADSPQQLKQNPQHLFDICVQKKTLRDFKKRRFSARLARMSSTLRKAVWIAGAVFWFCVSFSVSFYFLTSFGYNLYLSIACENWPSTTGQVSYSYISEDKIEYTYTVNGIPHTNSRIAFDDRGGYIRETYPLSSSVTVYYEPSNPYQSVLERSPLGFNGYLSLIMGIIFLGLGWICFNWGIGRYKNTIIDPTNWT